MEHQQEPTQFTQLELDESIVVGSPNSQLKSIDFAVWNLQSRHQRATSPLLTRMPSPAWPLSVVCGVSHSLTEFSLSQCRIRITTSSGTTSGTVAAEHCAICGKGKMVTCLESETTTLFINLTRDVSYCTVFEVIGAGLTNEFLQIIKKNSNQPRRCHSEVLQGCVPIYRKAGT